METKRLARAGRCGYRFDSVIRRQCKAKTRTLVVKGPAAFLYPVCGNWRWEHRCRAHKDKP